MKEKVTKESLVICLKQYQEYKSKYDELREKYYDCLRSGVAWSVISSSSYYTEKESLVASLIAITSLICDSLIDALDVPEGVENV